MSELSDRDSDGIPDVIEDAIEEAQDIKKRFGVKMILIVMLVGLIVAGYGVGAFFYLDMSDKYKTLQGQYDYEKGRWELDEKYQLIKERDVLLLKLKDKQKELDELLAKAAAARARAEEELAKKPYKEKNENEANKLSIDGLRDRFEHFGIPSTPRDR